MGRHWILTLWIIVSAVCTVAFCGFACVQVLRASPACAYEYPCDENPPGCTNDDGCLGECRCDLDDGECVPLRGGDR